MITRYAVGPAIDVIGRDHGVNYLHKSSRSLDCASDSSFSHCLVGRNFFAIMREYVRKPPPFPLERDAAGARECGAT